MWPSSLFLFWFLFLKKCLPKYNKQAEKCAHQTFTAQWGGYKGNTPVYQEPRSRSWLNIRFLLKEATRISVDSNRVKTQVHKRSDFQVIEAIYQWDRRPCVDARSRVDGGGLWTGRRDPTLSVMLNFILWFFPTLRIDVKNKLKIKVLAVTFRQLQMCTNKF